MPEDQRTLDPDYERQELQARLFTQFRETGERCYFKAARLLDKPGDPSGREETLDPGNTWKMNPPHRPPIDDEAALWEMGRLVYEEGCTANRASLWIADTMPQLASGHSKEATSARLRRKFRDKREYYVNSWDARKRERDTIEALFFVPGLVSPRGLLTGLNPEGLNPAQLMRHVKERLRPSPLRMIEGLNREGLNAAQLVRDAEAWLRPSPLRMIEGLNREGPNAAQLVRDAEAWLRRSPRRH